MILETKIEELEASIKILLEANSNAMKKINEYELFLQEHCLDLHFEKCKKLKEENKLERGAK